MVRKVRLGVLVPSSNTALEPLTQAMIASIQEPDLSVSVHFSRFRVTHISLSASSDAQFQRDVVLEAARLLADARVDVIGWSGTSAGWMGFEKDEKLCEAIEQDTGIPATTSTLGLNRVLERIGAKQLGLVTPYAVEMNDAIRSNYAGIGIDIPISLDQHLGILENTKIADIDEATLDNMVAAVVKEGASVVTTFCTNLSAAQRVDHWEKKYDITVLDSVATVVWDMLRLAIGRPNLVKGWGRMMSN
jgi:maleate isomerase